MGEPPAIEAKIVAMRQHGFPHATICCLIAGDTHATGAQADTISALTSELCRSDLDDDDACYTGDGGSAVSASDKTTTASAGLTKTSEEPASPTAISSTSYGSRSAAPHPLMLKQYALP
ncbi:hypothetical protein PF004_g32375, partial [Phytophthora fragariae]